VRRWKDNKGPKDDKGLSEKKFSKKMSVKKNIAKEQVNLSSALPNDKVGGANTKGRNWKMHNGRRF